VIHGCHEALQEDMLGSDLRMGVHGGIIELGVRGDGSTKAGRWEGEGVYRAFGENLSLHWDNGCI
jgi:hypothetical protein